VARSKNDEQSESRRYEILATALEVIEERGFSETRIGDIAKRAGISNGLIMYYFPTKVDLLVGAIEWAEGIWYHELQESISHAATARERLEGMVAIFLIGGRTPMLQMEWPLWLDLWSQSTRNNRLSQVHSESDERWRASLTQVIESGITSGEFSLSGSLDNTVIALAAMFDGFAVNIACHDGDVDAHLAFTIAMRFTSLALGFVWQADSATSARLERYFDAPVTTA